jgi:hypothetical protein
MPIVLETGIATIAAPLAVLALTVIFTRLSASDTATRAVHHPHAPRIRPGRHDKLGGAGVRVATLDSRDLVWAILALAGWIALVISLDVVRR